MRLVLAQLFLTWLYHLVSAEEQKTITLELKRKVTGPDPAYYVSTNTTIYSEEDMKRRGLQTIEKTMTNFQNLQYYSDLFIGDSKKQMTFIYDTGSSYLWVPLNNCTCSYATNKYTPSGSWTTSGQTDTIVYGSGSVVGVKAEDNVRATSAGNAVKMSKFMVIRYIHTV